MRLPRNKRAFSGLRPRCAARQGAGHPSGGIVNALTIDVEDWAHGMMGGRTPITPRVLRNVERTLKLLEQHGIRATFFALGKVCARFPQILPAISAAGHEIGSHGYGHDLLFNMSPAGFRDDLRRSIDVIGEQTGVTPVGYRAPAFSVTRSSLWAGPILAEMGFKYSSSIFPFAGPRYGIADAPPHPFRWCHWDSDAPLSDGGIPATGAERTGDRGACDLLEFPLTTLALLGRRWPVSGGGYLRLLPSCFLRSAIHQANRKNRPAVVYMHPYELDAHELRDLARDGWRFGRGVALTQSLFRCLFRSRLEELFHCFRFAPMREVLGLEACGVDVPR